MTYLSSLKFLASRTVSVMGSIPWRSSQKKCGWLSHNICVQLHQGHSLQVGCYCSLQGLQLGKTDSCCFPLIASSTFQHCGHRGKALSWVPARFFHVLLYKQMMTSAIGFYHGVLESNQWHRQKLVVFGGGSMRTLWTMAQKDVIPSLQWGFCLVAYNVKLGHSNSTR